MKKRTRNIEIKFYVTPEENALIEQNMALLGTDNRSAFIRKMLIDGQIIKLDLPKLRELLYLLRNISNNFNQLARRVNASGRIYAEDISDMKSSLEKYGTRPTGYCTASPSWTDILAEKYRQLYYAH